MLSTHTSSLPGDTLNEWWLWWIYCSLQGGRLKHTPGFFISILLQTEKPFPPFTKVLNDVQMGFLRKRHVRKVRDFDVRYFFLKEIKWNLKRKNDKFFVQNCTVFFFYFFQTLPDFSNNCREITALKINYAWHVLSKVPDRTIQPDHPGWGG